jgi:hypothetical protein
VWLYLRGCSSADRDLQGRERRRERGREGERGKEGERERENVREEKKEGGKERRCIEKKRSSVRRKLYSAA